MSEIHILVGRRRMRIYSSWGTRHLRKSAPRANSLHVRRQVFIIQVFLDKEATTKPSTVLCLPQCYYMLSFLLLSVC